MIGKIIKLLDNIKNVFLMESVAFYGFLMIVLQFFSLDALNQLNSMLLELKN